VKCLNFLYHCVDMCSLLEVSILYENHASFIH
jgi:hypothetical protein